MSGPARSDDEQRFVQLYRRYQPHILAYARRRLPEADAVEVVADTFVAAWRHLDSAPDEPLPWLYRIAGNTAANQWRRNGSRGRLHDRLRAGFRHSTSPDPAVATVHNDAIATALAALSETDREVLRLAAWEGLDGAELAEALGCRIGISAAKVRLHRARQRLAQQMEGSGPKTTASFETATEVSR